MGGEFASAGTSRSRRSILRRAGLMLWAASVAIASLSVASLAAAQDSASQVERLRDAALRDDLAWDVMEDLTTEVGPRLAGTEAEARARDWAVRKLKSLGFSNVHIEPYDMPVWVRGEERAEIVAPFPQKLVVTALGNSGATPAGGIAAEVVAFDTLAALEAASDAQVRGVLASSRSKAIRSTERG